MHLEPKGYGGPSVSEQNQVNVLRATKIKKILSITASGVDLNKSHAKYFEDCGNGVGAWKDWTFNLLRYPMCPPDVIYSFIKKKFLEHRNADAIYILGSGLAALRLVVAIERNLGVPVGQPIAARNWEFQRRVHVHQPIKGYGSLLETLPA